MHNRVFSCCKTQILTEAYIVCIYKKIYAYGKISIFIGFEGLLNNGEAACYLLIDKRAHETSLKLLPKTI